MKKYTETKYPYTLCIPLEKTDESYKFIKMNSDYRHNAWNNFVSQIYKMQVKYGITDIFKVSYNNIDACKKWYFREVEQPSHIYDTYCVGISEQIAKDMKKGLASMRGNKKYKTEEQLRYLNFRYHKYDIYRGSFKVHNKTAFKDGKHSTRLHILNRNEFSFRVRLGCYQPFNTKENIYTHMEYDMENEDHTYYNEDRGIKFKRSDVREVGFKYEGKCIFVLLTIYVQYTIKDRSDRYTYAGIDTGIHNPVVLYHPIDDDDIDSDKNYEIYRYPDKVDRKIQRLLERIKGVQCQMDKKYEINKKRVRMGELEDIYTKSYLRLRRKFRRLWKKIGDIKRNWRYCVANKIASSHRYICVDKFTQPNPTDIPYINTVNRYHAMYVFNEVLEYMCQKTQTGYMATETEGSKGNPATTNTCSKCGTQLDIPLTLRQRTFKCINPNCNYKRDRDFNAARNCCILLKYYCENLTEA